jgi:hypothetical protein
LIIIKMLQKGLRSYWVIYVRLAFKQKIEQPGKVFIALLNGWKKNPV